MRQIETTMGPLPLVGQGTWTMGSNPANRKNEVAALQLGIDLGMTLLDTAEMYAEGGAEEVTAEAIRGRRDSVFVVSKVLPQNASREGTIQAAERSLARLEIECMDLYLLHWEGSHPLEGTLAAMEELVKSGKTRFYGLSNFDTDAMKKAAALPEANWQSNQVLYNLSRRGPEASLIPYCRETDVMVMSYSPVEQARLNIAEGLKQVGEKHNVTPYTVAVAWTVQRPGVMTIPKATQLDHVRANASAGDLVLDEEDMKLLDQEYPRQSNGLEFL